MAESDASEVEALPGYLLLVPLLDRVHGILKSILNDFWNLLVDPSLGRLDSVPHDEVSAEGLLEEERWAHVLELVESLWHLQSLADRLVSSLQVDESQREEAA